MKKKDLNNKTIIFPSAFKYKLIYVAASPDDELKDLLKIGDATSDSAKDEKPNSEALNNAANKRIKDWSTTAARRIDLLYTESTFHKIKGKSKSFLDHDVHSVLKRSDILPKRIANSKEWFPTDLETAKNAISAVKKGKSSLHPNQISVKKTPIIFRPEQKDAIELAKKKFKKINRVLWNAKMRFGKTLCGLQVIKEHDFRRTLILTHRPVVNEGWYDDFKKIFTEKKSSFLYGSKEKGETFNSLEKKIKERNTKYIYFISIQDLRGSETVGGDFEKNDKIFSTKWDFIIIDEAHEGTQTELGENVISELKNKDTKILELSGTPFNLFNKYKPDQVFTWDYVMEQRAKKNWNIKNFGDSNPYSGLPRLNIYTYDLSKEIKIEQSDSAFNFKEFFRTNQKGRFFNEPQVRKFLDLLCDSKNINYPFSKPEFQENFRHTLWKVPGVKEARALSKLLNEHRLFGCGAFEIINVAGEGDHGGEISREKPLKKVISAIGNNPEETRTITITCGRLTTGVSVKPWTAVFMLSGSYNTSATSYMQTIFRVQTPAVIGGKIKEECFVFDFSPDRTLKIIADTAKISKKVGETTAKDRDILQEFLNFCPIISHDGSRMRKYDVDKMLGQLKKVYVERVVKNGFEDNYLYNKAEFMKLDEVGLESFNNLQRIIGTTKSIPKTNLIDINKQGFNEEEYQKLEIAKNKNKKELSEQEKQLLLAEKERKKIRDTAISILRGISIRMPLLIYGAKIKNDEEITINNFTKLVDDESWLEFMPKGVTKETFEKFKKYYEPDVFANAGKHIRKTVKDADSLGIEERIDCITSLFGNFKNPDKETVLTPWRVVNKHMSNCIGGYVFFDENFEKKLNTPRYHKETKDDVFGPKTSILEINSKSGLYPLYVAYCIYRNYIKKEFPGIKPGEISVQIQREIWDKVVRENIFVICKTKMAKSITQRTLIGFRNVKLNTKYFQNIVMQISNKSNKLIKKIKDGKNYWKINKTNDMKFNVIIGNPPYQETGGSGGNNDAPIFQHFCNLSSKLSTKYVSLIIPSRWFAQGRENLLGDFRKQMLNCGQIEKLHVFNDSREMFPNVEIKGGVCFYLQNKLHNGKCDYVLNNKGTVQQSNIKLNSFDILIREPFLAKIVEKVDKKRSQLNLSTVDTIISSDTPFGIPSNPKTSKKNPFKVYANSNSDHDVLLYHIEKTVRKIEYVSKKDINKNMNDVEKIKVFLNGASGSGNDPKVLGDPEFAPENSVCSQSYIYSAFDSEDEAKSFIKYIKTKFFRALVSAIKITQSAPKRVYRFVPLEIFRYKNDIDWKKSIFEINQQLYKKYELTNDEVGFIDNLIQPMN